MEKYTMEQMFENRDDRLKVIYTKVSEHGNKTGVQIAIINRIKEEKIPHVFDPIMAEKADLLKKAAKLRACLQNLDIDLEDEMETIIDQAREVVKNKIATEYSEKTDIITMVGIFYKKALELMKDEAPKFYVEENYLFLESGCLNRLLTENSWNKLAFKRQLKSMGLIEVTGNRAYDFCINASAKNSKGYTRYLKIQLNNRNINFKELFEEVEAA